MPRQSTVEHCIEEVARSAPWQSVCLEATHALAAIAGMGYSRGLTSYIDVKVSMVVFATARMEWAIF